MYKVILLAFLALIFSTNTGAAEVYSVEGFPRYTGASIFADLVAADINNDGLKEIIVAPDNRMIYAIEPDGSVLFEYTAGTLRSDLNRKPALADLNGDGKLELVVYGNPGIHYCYLHYLDSSGGLINDTLVGMNVMVSSPGVTGDNIVLAGVSPGNPPPETGASGVYAFDGSGNELWYLETGWVDRYSSIVTGDINGDGFDEAGVLIDNGLDDFRIVILKIERTKGSVIWEKDVGGKISGVAFEDIDNDGIKDVIAGTANGVFVWNGAGSLIWSNSVPSTTHSVPEVTDINGDGVNDVVIGSDWQNKLYAISNGNIMPGFPVSTIRSVWSHPATGDLDGDGSIDIAAGDYGGYVYAWDSSGNPLPGFPFIPAFDSFHSGGVIEDLDGDGIAELIMGNYNGNVYAWTTKLRDLVPPVTTDNTDDLWYNGDVRVNLSAVDDVSGVAATYYTLDGSEPDLNSSTGNEILLTEEGTNVIKYFSIDNAGNREDVKTAYTNIDKSLPLSYVVQGNEWYNNKINVNLVSSDSLSGIATVSYTVDGTVPVVSYEPVTNISIVSEGIHIIDHFSMDNAGNTEPVKRSVIKLDLTLPEVQVNSPLPEDCLHSDIITINFTGSDGLSGISSLTAFIDGIPVSNSQEFDMLDLEVGNHEFSLVAVDNAGNKKTQNLSFNVLSNIDSMIALNARAVENSWITSEITASLTGKLASAKQKINNGQDRTANNIIKAYINEVEAEAGKTITLEGAEILKTEAAYVYIASFSKNQRL